MTLQRRIQRAAATSRVQQGVVERDYAQGYVLLGIASVGALRDTLVFKGGTALKKVYFREYRFSEDLDFSGVGAPRGDVLDRAVRDAIELAQAAAHRHAPVMMSVERRPERWPHPAGQEAFAVRIQFPWHRQAMVNLKIEVTHDEPVLLSARELPVLHGYGEDLDAIVRAYSLEEVSAEKLRATRQTQAKLAARGWARARGRDFFDLWHLARLAPGHVDWAEVSRVLPAKCALREVAIASLDDVFDPVLIELVRATWERTVGPFVPELPDLDLVLDETRARLADLLVL